MIGDDDLGVFFNPEDFAITATYNGSTEVDVIFDRAYFEANGIASTGPQALAKASDFSSSACVGRSLVIPGKGSFTITNREPQDDGLTVVLSLRL